MSFSWQILNSSSQESNWKTASFSAIPLNVATNRNAEDLREPAILMHPPETEKEPPE